MSEREFSRQSKNRQERPEDKEFEEQVVNVDRVARVVKGGRRFRFRVLVVVGDKKGRLGIGLSKGADVTSAVTKAVEDAKKHIVTINLYKHTIPHGVEAKVAGAHIIIKPASAGTGLIAGGVVRTVLELAGVKNALSKSLGSSNKVNLAYATQKALLELVPAKNWVTMRKVSNSATEVKSFKQVEAQPVAAKTNASKLVKPKKPVKTAAKKVK